MADLTSEANDQQMKRAHQCSVVRQERVCLLVGITLGLDQSKPGEHASDMCVDWEIRLAKREEHDDPSGLLPNAGRSEQPPHRGVEVPLSEEGEIQPAALAVNPMECPVDCIGFLPMQPADTYGFCDGVDGRSTDGVERFERREERAVRSISVGIVGVLGQDGQHKRLDGIGAGDLRHAEVVDEPISEPGSLV